MTKLHLFLLAIAFLSSLQNAAVLATKKAYIVYLGGHSHGANPTSADFESATQSHYQLLGSTFGSEELARSAIFYSYTKHINGFAAMLEEEEATLISEHPDVISVFENTMKSLHTTRSWDVMGGFLNRQGKAHPESIWAKANYGDDVIIANFDTGSSSIPSMPSFVPSFLFGLSLTKLRFHSKGVWPESGSFDDKGYGPVPKRWRGICQNSTKHSFHCNRKLIGARFYDLSHQANSASPPVEYSPRDSEGHGTHTLSTAAGGIVRGANIYGEANGTARGGSPHARVAAYKVCWGLCADANILAAFDDAIHDGVDVISLSVGGLPYEYLFDSIALGSFHAVQRGITVVCSAGNDGPTPGTVSNIAPWIFTVGASTIDREFYSLVTLGSNKKIKGVSLSSKSLPAHKPYPLIDGSNAKRPNSSAEEAGWCYPGTLDPEKVRGKIVVCTRDTSFARVEKGVDVLKAGGAGMILANSDEEGNSLLADPHFLPASMITYKDALRLSSYLKSTKSPTATISPVTTVLGVKPAPAMASFSSRGPNLINPEILKPDITAPGVDILAAFTEEVGPTMLDLDKRRVRFNVMSGTSMSCPHISGVAGLLKKLHPRWSPAVIRSAIMTTARTRDNTRTPMKDDNREKAIPFDYGAGHVRPNRAMDPGLVYDITFTDYVHFLCSRGYNASNMAQFIGKRFACPSKTMRAEDLNYPSITVPNLQKSFTVSRTVRNVGTPGTYNVRIKAPFGIHVSVKPQTLEFAKVGEEKTFQVTLRSRSESVGVGYVFGGLTWTDGKHYVRSPLVVNAFS
ncbi:subtilisin-like protease SBT5.3 [Musa acuminata AAA Group]|uniref:subtilisin-like protease SBT5.3 n=1 Tax=Musa acuminata AAA Group TaxID=214697 RepID=UPI0031DB1B93